MLNIPTRNQVIIGLILTLLIMVTRGHHFATLSHLPGVSWAAFFLAGFYLRSKWALPGLLALTWLLDFVAITWGGSSGFCLTGAYVFLLPAYAALWFSGYWYANHYRFELRSLIPLIGAVLIGSTVCELFSSGGFYFFSGRFVDTNFTEFGMRLMKYYPSYLQSLAFYVGTAAIIHIAFTMVLNTTRLKKQSTNNEFK